jgi:ribosome recycling factor
MSESEVITEGKERFAKILTHLKDQLRRIRTGRASSALVDNLRVDYYGTPTPISQLAAISIPEPRQIVIKPFDVGILKEMVKTVAQADLGSSPQDDGKLIRLVLPPLSGDQRDKYAAKVKDMCEESRVSLRNGRRDLNKQADALKKDGDLTEDENRKLHDDVQTLLKDFEGQVETIQSAKVAQIKEV